MPKWFKILLSGCLFIILMAIGIALFGSLAKANEPMQLGSHCEIVEKDIRTSYKGLYEANFVGSITHYGFIFGTNLKLWEMLGCSQSRLRALIVEMHNELHGFNIERE